jgi:DNA ligase D-like protein (predicted 3'-phosphoesterase)
VSGKDRLEAYREKRDFGKTSEPSGRKGRKGGEPIFVIQKHDASRLHYDFRIEVDGVLKSWAVPKGPSTDPREKRLAVPTEDHPMEYADFEGVIPEGEYGAGTVIVWDRGTYENLKEKDGKKVPMEKSLLEGHVTIRLDGKKLKGGYALIRTGKGKKPRWLLVKMADEEADARRNPVSSQPRSAVTGRTLKQVAEEA